MPIGWPARLWEFAEMLQVPPSYFFPNSDGNALECENAAETHMLKLFRTMPTDKQGALILLLGNE